MCSQDNPGKSFRNFGYPSLANATDVFLRTSSVNSSAPHCESQQVPIGTSNSDEASCSTQPTESPGLQNIREILQQSGVPTDVVNVVMLSWRPSTHKQYSTYINKWTTFCCQRKVDPLRPTVICVLEFLQSLFDQGLSYATLNTARSAISNLDLHSVLTGTSKPVGQHPLVCRYLRGVFNQRKPVSKYTTIWPVDKVLDHLNDLWPLERLSTKERTYKLVMLTALTTGQRCQTLTFLDISQDHIAGS